MSLRRAMQRLIERQEYTSRVAPLTAYPSRLEWFTSPRVAGPKPKQWPDRRASRRHPDAVDRNGTAKRLAPEIGHDMRKRGRCFDCGERGARRCAIVVDGKVWPYARLLCGECRGKVRLA